MEGPNPSDTAVSAENLNTCPEASGAAGLLTSRSWVQLYKLHD
jgi:hypothetical protein